MTHSKRQLNIAAIDRDDDRRRFRWALAGLFLVFTTIVFVACGGSDGSPVAPTAPTAAPVARLLQQGTFTLRAPDEEGFFFALTTVTDNAAGRWEATVDWGSDANTLWMWVADGVCSVEQFASEACPFEAACPCRFAIRSETATPKPRLLTIPAATGGTRTLVVANLGPRAETVQYRVNVTSSSSVASERAQAAGVASVAAARKPRLSER